MSIVDRQDGVVAETKELLKKSLLFSGLTDAQLDQVRNIGVTKKYEKGQVIFSEGEKATGFFVNLSGKVKVYKISADGREQILHIILPTEAFAEAAVFTGSTYPAFAESLTRTRVLYFPKETFFSLIGENPQLSLNMIGALSFWLRRFVDLVEELSLKDVSARVSKFLLDSAIGSGQEEKNGIAFDLGVSKTQLAFRLGTISETLSRAFRKLQDRNIIRVEGKKITILDRGALEKISSGLML
jgi:CRP/FNR family transcriptional regulator